MEKLKTADLLTQCAAALAELGERAVGGDEEARSALTKIAALASDAEETGIAAAVKHRLDALAALGIDARWITAADNVVRKADGRLC